MLAFDDHAAAVTVTDPCFGKLGYLVIDTAYYGKSIGGVRLLPDVYPEEISHLARTMTRKYLFAGLPCGGAKAGVILKGQSAADRDGALRAFGRAIKPFVRNGFSPGLDMGCSPEDLRAILSGAGVPLLRASWPLPHGYTAMSVIASLDVALERRGMDWAGCRIAIEGFGNVGSRVAAMAAAKGATIASVSNTSGSLSNPSGLDVAAMLAQKAAHGSGFIRHFAGGTLGDKEKIFSAGCDVLVPCARSWSINRSNLGKITAHILICGANVPMDMECERALWKNGKLIVPDAVANCGGVLGTTLARVMDDSRIASIIARRFKKRVHDVLDAGVPPSDYVTAFCSKRRLALAEALAPAPPATVLGDILGHVRYHLLDPFLLAAVLERGLFPE